MLGLQAWNEETNGQSTTVNESQAGQRESQLREQQVGGSFPKKRGQHDTMTKNTSVKELLF